MKTLLIIGCGSIGSRHARNAKSLGVKNIILCDADSSRAEKLGKEIGSPCCYSSWQTAWENHPDIQGVVIATPTSLHLEPALFAATRGTHIFVEKPLAHTLVGVDDLLAQVEQQGVVGMMGQSYRFHAGFRQLKRRLDDGVVGKVYHVHYWSGQYLPDWHPGLDYRTEYAARKDLGGGVLLTSMSHCFDTIEWLFGQITDLNGWKAKQGNLDIDVEDSAFILAKTEQGTIIQVVVDFLRRTNEHAIVIVGERGNISVDFNTHTIVTKVGGEERVEQYSFDANGRYREELKHFFDLVAAHREEHDLDLKVGKRILELIFDPGIRQV